MSGTVGQRIPSFTNTYSLDFDGVDDYVETSSDKFQGPSGKYEPIDEE